MEPSVWVPIASAGGGAVVGAVVGAVFGWISAVLTFRREWRGRLTLLKIESYAEWCDGMEELIGNYARQSSAAQSGDGLSRCEQRLLLIEDCEDVRRLIREVRETIPAYGSEDYIELAMLAQTPEWEWEPFRTKIDELRRRVRGRIRRLKI